MIEVPLSSVMNDLQTRTSRDTALEVAADRLRNPEVPALVVRDSTDAPEGIVTASDIVAVVAEGGGDVSVESVMSTPVITAADSTPHGIAADRMRDAGVRTIVAVDTEDKYAGLVTREDLAPYFSRHRLETDWKNEPLTLDGTGPGDASISAESPVEDAVE